jgi:DNA-binding CsgD family transcriptional regulator
MMPKIEPLLHSPLVKNIDIEPRDGGDYLSPLDRQVLLQVVEGHANKVIAGYLRITEAAVKVQLESLLRKISVENRTQATILAFANLPELVAPPCDSLLSGDPDTVTNHRNGVAHATLASLETGASTRRCDRMKAEPSHHSRCRQSVA